MLSKKYKTIKHCLTGVSKINLLHRRLIVLANMYVDIDKCFRFSYLPDENGEYEFIDALRRHYVEDFVYFDVGAHFGTYTDMIVERFKNYKGHLFEPTKTTFEKCQKQHGNNDKLVINNAALSDIAGEVEYRVYPDDPSRNGIAGVGPEVDFNYEIDSVPCWTGDDYCRTHDIDHINLLKIDAEGYDLHVIKGFENTLTEGKVDIIQFEYNVKHSETKCMLGDFYTYLEKKGYLIGPLRPEGVWFTKFDFKQNNFENGSNYVACRPEFRDLLTRFK